MNYDTLLKEIQKASLFDLFRINAIIYNEIDNPERIRRVKMLLKPGMRISYFEPADNRVWDAVVLELKRTRLLVENISSRKKWSIQYAAVNLAGADTAITVSHAAETLDRNTLKVGDTVGFRHDNTELYGTVIKLNPKRAKIQVSEKEIWTVSYPLLFKVIEGNSRNTPGVIDVLAVPAGERGKHG